MNCNEHENKILIVSHVAPGGGAGKYIQKVICSVEDFNEDVFLTGEFVNEKGQQYLFKRYANVDLTKLNLVIYNGPSLLAKFFFFLKSFIFLFKIFNKTESFNCYNKIIFTSSIQILDAFRASKYSKNSKVYVILQENIKLNIVNRFILKLFKNYVNYISISRTWSAAANNVRLENFLLENSFDSELIFFEKLDYDFDLLYVGGDQKIKGFDFLIRFIENYRGDKVLSLCLLGDYSELSKEKVNRICSKSICIKFVGSVNNIGPYLRASKVLLLPITKLHFCRPAIEAGLQGKTFVYPEFSDNDDFSSFLNCAKYKADSLNSFIQVILKVVNDSEYRNYLEINNKKFCNEFMSLHSFDTEIKKIINER